MKQLLSVAVFLLLCGLTARELPSVLARFDNIELKSERFRLFNIPLQEPQRRAALKKLVDTEVYLIITRQLLARSGIAPDIKTAGQYIHMRKQQFPAQQASSFFKNMERSITQPEFQLKCALYFTFYAAVPATVEPDESEINRHYLLNKRKFRRPVNSTLALFRAGSNDRQGKEKARLILSRLRQGEDFYVLARQFDPEGQKERKKPSPEMQPYFKKIMELPPGGADAVETPRGIFIVKVISRDPETYHSLEEMRPYITEMLASARLKNTLEQYIREIVSKKPIQYFF